MARGHKKDIPPEKVEKLAQTGRQLPEIASKLDVGVSTIYEKNRENPAILEAYKRGRQHFVEYVKQTRCDRVLEAFDDLIRERNPAAVIFAMKAIVGLQENVQVTHSVQKEITQNDDRLAELEAKRKALQDSEIDAEFAREPDNL